ncbi:putative tail fiber protein [Buttiauxella ferragutiae ATCC 51602]|uniref:Tail fiber protein n=1 Tax=Buttiauxella ferragutiae ATCC 51602 TaxID=1354252 RepID=A0ABX2W6H2_9ENTR|nr:phage tail protein [Buttiauxella ferragutiae]OAT26532.1 putative tail fiber protein [Buttiauxella ferragutiae ATCC 51602]
MSHAVITKAFTEWKAQQAVNNLPVTLDEFIFALVPDLDLTKPVSNTEGVPAADKIVHRQAVSKTGVVNANSVVYSVTLGADVGDFDFNWIGLVNKATGTLAMIIHAPTQRKIKNDGGQQGNVLVRSMMMEYSGAQSATNITTPAETWQIDFTARLAGMDEAVRLAALDIYGAGAFFDNGFLVAKNGAQYFVTKGLGYVGGLRAALPANQNITVSAKPTKVWADVCYQGTLTSAYQTSIKFTVADSLTDYQVNGVAHYVFALASIDASGAITDLRPKGSLGDQQGNNDFLRKDKSLSDVNDAVAARRNIGLKGAAVLDVGATANTVAAGDDTRIVNALQKGDNLSDVENKAQARANLELKSAALRDVQTARGDVTAGRVLVNGGTFAIGANQVGMHVGDIDFQFGGSGTFVSPGSIKALNGATELAGNAIYVRGTGNKHLWFHDLNGAEIGLLYASDDKVLHMRAGQGPSFDVNSKGDATLQGTGTLYANNVYAKRALCIGDDDTGFLTNGDGSAFIRANNANIGWWDSSKFVLDRYFQANGGLQTSSIELTGGASVIDFHFNGDNDDYNIRLFNNAYNQLSMQGVAANPLFNHSSGQFVGKGISSAWGAEWGNYHTAPFNASDIYASGGDAWCPMIKGHGQKGTGFATSISFGFYIPPNNIFNNPVIYAKNDNGSFGWWMFNNQSGDINYANAQGAFTMATQPWVNGRVSDVQTWVNGNFCTIPQRDAKADISWVRTYFVQSIRFGASGEYQERSNNERVGGGVMTSFADRGSSNYWIRIRPLQYLINDVWYTAAYS